MPLVNPTLPNDGESADAGDISGPFLALLAVFNGHIGADNFEPGTIAAALGTSSITTAMITDANITTAKIADHAITPAKVALPITVDESTASSPITYSPLASTRMTIITGLHQALTFGAITGFYDGQPLTVRVKDDGTARALAYDASWVGVGITLPTTTTAGKVLYLNGVYNTVDATVDVLSVGRKA